MGQPRNKRSRNNSNKKQRKVIRCKVLNRPVFEHEVCSNFVAKISSHNQNTCENCQHSF